VIEDRYREELTINLNPLQTAGRTDAATRRAVSRYVDGYSVCDACAGVLHDVEKPPIKPLVAELCEFLNVDAAITTSGAREAKFAVMHSVCNPGDTIVVDSNAHYTTHVAAENVGLNLVEVQSSGYPEYEITAEGYAGTLDEVRQSTGKPAAIALLTHVDGDYGNLADAAAVAATCHEAGVPFLLNAAYTAGRMPVDVKSIGADFIACSCHKSWGACGPIGVLGVAGEWSEKIFRVHEKFPKKNIEFLGCTARGATIMSLMAALPRVKERINNWATEVENARRFSAHMESLGDIKQLGIKPTQHDLIRFETPLFYEIGKGHRKRGYFLHKELAKRGITGLKPGQTKWFKMSTYGLSEAQLEYVMQAFTEIAAM